uniref:Uncharacterized protein n=1 Tax=Timema bartmani TaxID=61472 RepID=A0A7R9I278_9NEOP|nr:unnamed protein product [Timema bartmani]
MTLEKLTSISVERSEIDPPIKFEECLIKEEAHDYQEAECCLGLLTLPPSKAELDKHLENLKSSLGQYETSLTKYKRLISHSAQTKTERSKCKEKECSKNARKGGKCFKHGGTQAKDTCQEEGCSTFAKWGGKCSKHGGSQPRITCKEEGCSKWAMRGGRCIKHGGTQLKNTCKEEGCCKWAMRGGKCIKHGGTQSKNTCKEEGCSKWTMRGGKCIKHGGTQAKKTCKAEGCSKWAMRGGKCSKHGGTRARNTCKEEGCPKSAQRGGTQGGGKEHSVGDVLLEAFDSHVDRLLSELHPTPRPFLQSPDVVELTWLTNHHRVWGVTLPVLGLCGLGHQHISTCNGGLRFDPRVPGLINHVGSPREPSRELKTLENNCVAQRSVRVGGMRTLYQDSDERRSKPSVVHQQLRRGAVENKGVARPYDAKACAPRPNEPPVPFKNERGQVNEIEKQINEEFPEQPRKRKSNVECSTRVGDAKEVWRFAANIDINKVATEMKPHRSLDLMQLVQTEYILWT